MAGIGCAEQLYSRLIRSQPGPPRSLRRSQDFPVSDFRYLAHIG
jgi:hypothetical protein